MITIRKSEERGHADHGWLDTYHTFSFADYHDPEWMGFQSLRVINDDTVAGGMGFGMHPHRDMEIITYILRGALQHRDSMGHSAILRPGEVQRITAGSGIEHSESNPSPDEPVHLLQIWIKPNQKNLKPDYQQKSFQAELNSGKLVLVASKKPSNGAIQINQDVDLFIAHLESGKSARHELKPDRDAWMQVAEGEIQLNGRTLATGDGAGISKERVLEISAKQPSKILLFDLAGAD